MEWSGFDRDVNVSIMWVVLLDAVFCETSEPRCLPDKQKRAKKTFEEMMKYIPGEIIGNTFYSVSIAKCFFEY